MTEVREHPLLPGTWEVVIIKDSNVTVILFGGHRAKEFAEEYVRYCNRNDG